MAMTKKDFIALADALKESRPLFGQDDGRLRQWEQDVHAVGNACSLGNPAFGRSRWVEYIKGNAGPNGGKV